MKRLACLLLLVCVLPGWAEDKEYPFKKGDRITFLGDSITAQYEYSSYLELYLTTRFPDWKLTFLNAGIGGDTANGGAGRFQSSVLDDKPTVVTINFGMNDAGYGAFNPAANKLYVEKTTAMLEMAKKAGVRVVLMSPNAVDRRKNPNFVRYVETQKQFYAPLKEIAEKHGATFVDQYAMTRAVVEKLEAEKKVDVVPYYDGFHTAPPGGLLMAHSILTGLKMPALVSAATIDVASKKADGQQCTITNLTASDERVQFERLDQALPMPIMKEWITLLPSINQLDDLNNYQLKVTGLKPGQYEVAIDGIVVTTEGLTSEALAKGVNLGNVRTGPIFDQAKKVQDLINAKNGLVNSRFFSVLRYQAPAWLADVAKERKTQELAKTLATIEKKHEEIQAAVKPVARKFEVRPATPPKSKK